MFTKQRHIQQTHQAGQTDQRDQSDSPHSANQIDPFAPNSIRSHSRSVIGRDLTILGDNISIISHDNLMINGAIRGHVRGRRICVGATGAVEGSICAERVEIDGDVRGAVSAVSITLNPTARVKGDLTHRNLIIQQGAEFQGAVLHTTNADDLVPDLTEQAPRRRHPSSPLAQSEVISFTAAEPARLTKE